jgi:hypothetical protein
LPDGDDRSAVDQVARVLRPGGLVVIRSNSAGFGPGKSEGGSAYRLSELRRLLVGSGLKVLWSSYVNMFPSLAEEVRGRLRFLAGRRGRSWRPHPSGGGLRLDVPSPKVNQLMGAVSTLERCASLMFRCPLPFGHSTMLLAQKPGGTR